MRNCGKCRRTIIWPTDQKLAEEIIRYTKDYGCPECPVDTHKGEHENENNDLL